MYRTLAGQAPITGIGIILVAWKLKLPPRRDEVEGAEPVTLRSKLKRIDFPGALFLSTSLLPILLLLDAGGQKFAWISWPTLVLVLISAFSGALFSTAESKWAAEPIFPLRLLANYDVLISYLGIAIQNASQTAVSSHYITVAAPCKTWWT